MRRDAEDGVSRRMPRGGFYDNAATKERGTSREHLRLAFKNFKFLAIAADESRQFGRIAV